MGKKIDHFGQLLLIVVIALLVAAGIIEEGYLLWVYFCYFH